MKDLLPPEGEDSATAFIVLPNEEGDKVVEEGCQLLRYTLGERGRNIAVALMRELAYNPENLLIHDKNMIPIPDDGADAPQEEAANGDDTENQ